jgi:pimeloyl-ACP methyl ester carboxylesterase
VAERVVDSAGVRIAVRDHGGTDADVVLLHGGGRTAADWDGVGGLLRRLGYRPVALDLRGHGRSGSGDWTWPAVLGDVGAVVTQLGLRRPAVIGHSLGGMLAALWAERHGDCPLAVNLDGHGNPTRPDQFAGLDPAAAAAAWREFARFAATMTEALPEHLRAVMRAVDALDLHAAYRATRCPLLIASGRGAELAELLPAPLRPAWVAYVAWNDRQLAEIARDVPLVSLASLPTGHDPHLEDPESLTNLLAGYLPG